MTDQGKTQGGSELDKSGQRTQQAGQGGQQGDQKHLVMNTTKDALKSTPGYKYDKNTTTWAPDKS
jgi:hypothetical protein